LAWQDVVLSTAAVVFFVSLVPAMVKRETRIPRTTSVPTAIGVYAQTAAFATLGLTLTAVLTLLIALAWTHLAVWRAVPPSTVA
jgi:hypothetical protein